MVEISYGSIQNWDRVMMWDSRGGTYPIVRPVASSSNQRDGDRAGASLRATLREGLGSRLVVWVVHTLGIWVSQNGASRLGVWVGHPLGVWSRQRAAGGEQADNGRDADGMHIDER